MNLITRVKIEYAQQRRELEIMKTLPPQTAREKYDHKKAILQGRNPHRQTRTLKAMQDESKQEERYVLKGIAEAVDFIKQRNIDGVYNALLEELGEEVDGDDEQIEIQEG